MKKVFFGQNDLRYLYFKYKDSRYYSLAVIVLTIVVCLMLIFIIIIPQAEVYFSIRQEAVALLEKNKKINDNIRFANSLDNTLLDSQLLVSVKALPASKDFAGLVNALNSAAIKSGVSISDYSISFEEKSNKQNLAKEENVNVVNSLRITFEIQGSRDGGQNFLKELYEKIPILEIESLSGDSKSMIVNGNFFYKGLPKISFKEDEPISAIADSKKVLLEKLSTWQEASDIDNFEPVGTSSAVPLF